MSEPLRFKPVNPAHDMVFSADGGWVSWEDYARLKAEVKELKYQPDPLTAYLYAAELAKDDIKRLKAEVERLTKYYIDPASILRLTEDGKQEKNGFGYITKFAIEVNKDAFEKLTLTMMAYWNAAKEGKQS